MIKHLHRNFVVIDENEPALIISSKLNSFLCNDKKVQMGHSKSDAQLNICPQFLPEFLGYCFSQQYPAKSLRENVAGQRFVMD